MYLQLLGPAPQILGDLLGEEPRAEKPLGESTTAGISVLLTSFWMPETLNNLGEENGTQPPHFGDARDITLTNKVEKARLLPWHPPQSQQDTMTYPNQISSIFIIAPLELIVHRRHSDSLISPLRRVEEIQLPKSIGCRKPDSGNKVEFHSCERTGTVTRGKGLWVYDYRAPYRNLEFWHWTGHPPQGLGKSRYGGRC